VKSASLGTKFLYYS